MWELLYNPKSSRDVGTLFYFRQQFHLVNVHPSVKKNYQSAEALFLSTTKAYICSAFMTWAGMKSINDKTAQNIKLPNATFTKEQLDKYLKDVIG